MSAFLKLLLWLIAPFRLKIDRRPFRAMKPVIVSLESRRSLSQIIGGAPVIPQPPSQSAVLRGATAFNPAEPALEHRINLKLGAIKAISPPMVVKPGQSVQAGSMAVFGASNTLVKPDVKDQVNLRLGDMAVVPCPLILCSPDVKDQINLKLGEMSAFTSDAPPIRD